MGEKHSAVGYLFREGAFLPAQETKPVRNEFGLDLFQHRGSVYEGKTGLQFCSLQQAEDLAGFVEKHGGNNVADNTGDNAAGNEHAEEQEVENTDGE